jgi:hypothetical protein
MQRAIIHARADSIAHMSEPAQHKERVLDRVFLARIVLDQFRIERVHCVERAGCAHDKNLRRMHSNHHLYGLKIVGAPGRIAASSIDVEDLYY